MTSMKQLRGRFVLLVLELYNYICGELQEMPAGIYGFEPETHDTPLTALLDDILSLVYGCTHFGELRRGISALLMDTNTPASLAATLNRVYQKFTAHVYRVTTASAVSTMTRHGYNSTQNAWSRRWLLDPGSVDIIDLRTGNQDAYADLRLVDVTQVVCALGCVDVTTDADMSSVSLRSAVLLSGNTPVIRTEIILDGRQHIYSAQSIGLFSILAGRRSVGEYAGSFSANGRSLHLDYFYLEEECQSSTGDAHAGSASVSSSGLETQENEEIFDGATMVRRVKLTLSLDHGPDSGVLSCCSDCRDLSVLVHAVTSVATFETSTPTTEWQGSEGSFLGLASTSRAALEWIQVTELQAGYITVSCRASGS
ncbi:hypothetical protein PF005_g24492 [Phytophthora fragariae]|uniref:Uncharacterized protein n=1 Tax=Phytophthora fragariae TaxID=53985 RepID=A0A6A3W7Q7_9STRA|nr:hypothetical protein PF005_g24492 [Phytophthora fragariae]